MTRQMGHDHTGNKLLFEIGPRARWRTSWVSVRAFLPGKALMPPNVVRVPPVLPLHLPSHQVLVRNVSGAKAAVGTALSALHLLAEAHNLCEDGRPYQALRAVDILRAR